METGSNESLFKHILVAVDESKQAEWATAVAGDFAKTTGAKVALVHAYRVDPGYSPELGMPIEDVIAELKEAGIATLRRHRSMLPSTLDVEERLIEGEPAQEIVSVAES